MRKKYAQIMDRLKVTDSMRDEVLKAVSKASSSDAREAQLKVHRARGWHRGLVAAACAAVACAVCLLVIPRTQIPIEQIASTTQPAVSPAAAMQTADSEEPTTALASSDGNPTISVHGIVDIGATTQGNAAGSPTNESRLGAIGNASGDASTDNIWPGGDTDNQIVSPQMPEQVPSDEMPDENPGQIVHPAATSSSVPVRPATTNSNESAVESPAPVVTPGVQTTPDVAVTPPVAVITESPVDFPDPFPPQCGPTTLVTASSVPEVTETPDPSPSPEPTEHKLPQANPTPVPQYGPSAVPSSDSIRPVTQEPGQTKAPVTTPIAAPNDSVLQD